MHATLDFNQTPLLVIWEVTRSCSLVCKHCRAEAIDQRHPEELTLAEGKQLLSDVRAMGTPLVVLTGGDPLQRDDLDELIAHAKEEGLRVGSIPATTDRLTRPRVQRLKDAGLDQMALSIDGCTAAKHDDFRGVPGSFAKAMEAAGWARDVGLPLQVNTVLAAWNANDFDELAKLVVEQGVVFWEVFFLVPTGRGAELQGCTTEQYEMLFDKLHRFSCQVDFIVKITEAPHYRVHVQRRLAAEGGAAPGSEGHVPARAASAHHRPHGGVRTPSSGVNSAKGFCFVDHVGNVCPSGFLPLEVGNVRDQSVIALYRDSPLFRELRDTSLLKGYCGLCEYKELCGGSRARAYAMTGDYQAEEPFCAYGMRLAAAT